MAIQPITENRRKTEKEILDIYKMDSLEHRCKYLDNLVGSYKIGIFWLIVVIIVTGLYAYNAGYEKAIEPMETYVRNCTKDGIDKKSCETKYRAAKRKAEDM